MPWEAYIFTFLFSTVKFIIAASVSKGFYDLSTMEIFVCTTLGGLFSLNFFYWFSSFLMNYNRKKRLKKIAQGKVSKKKKFTKLNKYLVRVKNSNSGLLILSTLGVLFLSLPLSGIILAKFYHKSYTAYLIGCSTVILAGLLLAFANDFIFNLF